MSKKHYMTHDEFHAEMMKIAGYKEGYEALEPEFALIDAVILARKNENLTQKQLAAKMGITQSALARLESGKVSPTLSTLQKILKSLNRKIKIVPA